MYRIGKKKAKLHTYASTNCFGAICGLRNVVLNGKWMSSLGLVGVSEMMQHPQPGDFIEFIVSTVADGRGHTWALYYPNKTSGWTIYQSFQGHFHLRSCPLKVSVQQYCAALNDATRLWSILGIDSIMGDSPILSMNILTDRGTVKRLSYWSQLTCPMFYDMFTVGLLVGAIGTGLGVCLGISLCK